MKRNTILKSLAVVMAMSFTFALAAKNIKDIVPSKNTATESRKLASFKDIEVKSAITVKYVQSEKYSARIQAPSNVLPYIRIKQNGDELEITTQSGLNFKGDPKATVTIYAPTLRDIEISGASTFNAENIQGSQKVSIESSGASTLNIGHMAMTKCEIESEGASTVNINSLNISSASIECSGASTLNIKGISATDIEVESDGASTANLSGTVNEADIKSSGASTVNAKKLSVNTGTVSASGASTIKARFDNYSSTSCGKAAKLDIR